MILSCNGERVMDRKKDKFKIINRDMLKYIAVAVMFIGHFLMFTNNELHFLGIPKKHAFALIQFQYIAPPIFFFFIAEGFHYTHSKKNYALRLLGFSVLTQLTYVLCNTLTFDIKMFFTEWNVIMTLFLGLVVLIIWECKLALPFRVLLLTACGAANWLLNMEWRIVGPLIILAFHLLRERPIIRLVVYELIIYGYFAIGMGSMEAIFVNLNLISIMSLPIVLITFFYNGKKGKYPKFSKYYFYIFYPAHYLLIFFVKLIVG